jgi:hypothetical protein
VRAKATRKKRRATPIQLLSARAPTTTTLTRNTPSAMNLRFLVVGFCAIFNDATILQKRVIQTSIVYQWLLWFRKKKKKRFGACTTTKQKQNATARQKTVHRLR